MTGKIGEARPAVERHGITFASRETWCDGDLCGPAMVTFGYAGVAPAVAAPVGWSSPPAHCRAAGPLSRSFDRHVSGDRAPAS